jgi:hypothetical protein
MRQHYGWYEEPVGFLQLVVVVVVVVVAVWVLFVPSYSCLPYTQVDLPTGREAFCVCHG